MERLRAHRGKGSLRSILPEELKITKFEYSMDLNHPGDFGVTIAMHLVKLIVYTHTELQLGF